MSENFKTEDDWELTEEQMLKTLAGQVCVKRKNDDANCGICIICLLTKRLSLEGQLRANREKIMRQRQAMMKALKSVEAKTYVEGV